MCYDYVVEGGVLFAEAGETDSEDHFWGGLGMDVLGLGEWWSSSFGGLR